jgi:hypothetical protein
MLESLSVYLALFEKWTDLFPGSDYVDLTETIKKTCGEFVAFLVQAIRYFQRSSFGN